MFIGFSLPGNQMNWFCDKVSPPALGPDCRATAVGMTGWQRRPQGRFSHPPGQSKAISQGHRGSVPDPQADAPNWPCPFASPMTLPSCPRAVCDPSSHHKAWSWPPPMGWCPSLALAHAHPLGHIQCPGLGPPLLTPYLFPGLGSGTGILPLPHVTTQTCAAWGTKRKNGKSMEICRGMASLGLRRFGGTGQLATDVSSVLGAIFWHRFWCVVWQLMTALTAVIMRQNSLRSWGKWYINKPLRPQENVFGLFLIGWIWWSLSWRVKEHNLRDLSLKTVSSKHEIVAQHGRKWVGKARASLAEHSIFLGAWTLKKELKGYATKEDKRSIVQTHRDRIRKAKPFMNNAIQLHRLVECWRFCWVKQKMNHLCSCGVEG